MPELREKLFVKFYLLQSGEKRFEPRCAKNEHLDTAHHGKASAPAPTTASKSQRALSTRAVVPGEQNTPKPRVESGSSSL